MRVTIIGAGAAGCFSSIELKRNHPDWEVTVLECGSKPLAKVAVTGGGRCNLTNTFQDVDRLEEAYPRGARLMRRVFGRFSPEDTVRWWEAEGVGLVAQEDGCIFPESQDAMQIVDTLSGLMRRLGVDLRCRMRAEGITPLPGGGFRVAAAGGKTVESDAVVLTTGGGPGASLRAMLPEGVDVTDTIPSLFTLKIADEDLHLLMGTVVQNTCLRLAGTKFSSRGTLLLTDWGVSGPATLKLSSYAARHLASSGYRGNLLIGWLGAGEEEIRELVRGTMATCGRKTLQNAHPDGLTSRLWCHILKRCGLREDMRWAELGGKGISRLVSELCRADYPVCGRARFKEEFVTCGGVDLASVDSGTLQSRRFPGLFFAGEVLDVDAVTGGFNLQAAWSTAMVVARAIEQS